MKEAKTTVSLNNLEGIQDKFEQLLVQQRGGELIELVMGLLRQICQDHDTLQRRLGIALRQLYGRKSEKISKDQLALIFELSTLTQGQDSPAVVSETALEHEPTSQSPEAESQTATPSSPQTEGESEKPKDEEKKKRPKNESIKNLPKDSSVHLVPEAERTCPKCGPRTHIGFATSSVVEFVPAHFRVTEYQCEKMVCRCGEGGIVVAESARVFEKIRASADLMSQLIIHKFQDGMPTYRQSKELARYGATFNPSTLGEWMRYGIERMEPLVEVIKQKILDSGYIQLDDTHIKVRDKEAQQGIRRSRLWGAVGGNLVYFWYTKDWSATELAKELHGYQGKAQVDGFGGYDTVVTLPNGTEVQVPKPENRLGCGMHIRRYFEEALQADDPRAAVALHYFQKVYALEAMYKSPKYLPENRGELRKAYSLPIVTELYDWIETLAPRMIPKTALAVAIGYALNQKTYFLRCFENGLYEIDNGEIERHFRVISIGRKAFLFAGSAASAKRMAIAYTVLGCCERHKVNPQLWMPDVLRKMEDGWPKAKIEALLPGQWKPP